jgi:hypothetical protein
MPRLLNVAVKTHRQECSPSVASVDDVTNVDLRDCSRKSDLNDKAAIFTFDGAERADVLNPLFLGSPAPKRPGAEKLRSKKKIKISRVIHAVN